MKMIELFLLILFLHDTSVSSQFTELGIPGTKQTISGYDTQDGTDAICWLSTSQKLEETPRYPNQLIRNSNVKEENVRLLRACPPGVSASLQLPEEIQHGDRPRTKRWYNYTVDIHLNTSSLLGDRVVSDRGSYFSVQIFGCLIRKTGFCSPFIHEQSNRRNIRLGLVEKLERGDRHGDSHVHSPYTYVYVSEDEDIQSWEGINVPFIINKPGQFFVIAAVQFFRQESNGTICRYDMAHAAIGEDRILYYQDPPDILDISSEVEIGVYTVSAAACTVMIFLLFHLIKHRSHHVIQLSQGPFLIFMLICSIVASASVFLLSPKNDIYCKLAFPLVLIPFHMTFAISIGRVWRIAKVVSPLLTERLSQGGFLARQLECLDFLFLSKNNRMHRRTSKLRIQISNMEIARVIFIVALPQIIIQVLALILQPKQVDTIFNEDESIGRHTCTSGYPAKYTISSYGLYYAILTNFLLLCQGHASRELPSLFNETQVIFFISFINFIVLLLGSAIYAVTKGPTTSPEVEVFIWVAVVISSTLITSIRTVLPKLQMVWKGETVVVSRLVTDHRLKKHKRASVSLSSFDGIDDIGSIDGMDINIPRGNQTAKTHRFSSFLEDQNCREEPSKARLENAECCSPRDSGSATGPFLAPNNEGDRHRHSLNSLDEGPSHHTLLSMISLQSCLKEINQGIVSGREVRQDEWTTLREMLKKVSKEFQNPETQWQDSTEVRSSRTRRDS